MHAAAFRALGLPHTYEAIRATASDLGPLVDALRRGGFDGFNVTIPHKQRVLSLADTVDASAAGAGTANTLVREEGGRIVAHNTDVRALASELLRLAPEAARRGGSGTVGVVLGTGGAARSAIAALTSELGLSKVVVRGRSLATEAGRKAFLASLGAALSPGVSCAPLAPVPDIEAGAAFVVQATSAGMEGAAPGESVADAIAWTALPAHAVALDVIYAPPVTPFLERATARGLRCANGLGMLAAQGARALELWLGVPAPYAAMLAAISPP